MALAIAAIMGSQTFADKVTKKGKVFTIEISKSAKGDKNVATIKVTPKKGHYCNPEYPWKLTTKSTADVKFEKEVYKKADAKKFGKPAVVFKVPYVAKSGTKATATLKMSICDHKQCETFKEELSL